MADDAPAPEATTGPDLDAAADELYGLHPDEFVARRNELVAAARAAKDRETATAIGALRKPSLGAWLGNVLARESPDEIGALEELGAALRAAQERMDGEALRTATGQRRELVHALVTRARRLARADGVAVGDGAARDLERTLAAALADPAAARALVAGRLTTGLEPGAGLDAGQAASAGPGHRRPPPRRATPAPAEERRGRDEQPEREAQREKAQREEREAAEREVRDRALAHARRELDDAEDAAGRARTRARQAERDHDAAADAVSGLEARLEQARQDEQQAREHLDTTMRERERAEQEADRARQRVEEAEAHRAELTT